MLTELRIRNFKGIGAAVIPLGDTVVFVGPNNSGKTTALQALALWHLAAGKWIERRQESRAKERTGVTLNRRDLVSIPVPSARLLWRDLKTSGSGREANGYRVGGRGNILFEIGVTGVTRGQEWRFELEFDFANDESLYCRAPDWPEDPAAREAVAGNLRETRIAFLPPMSGLAANEYRKEPGEIGVLIGEGRTAEVLRNLCHRLYVRDRSGGWADLTDRIEKLFKVRLLAPEYIQERGELRLAFDQGGLSLDLSCSGRGFQQILLLLAYLYENPESILLLDEPDAHLEIVRQREVYSILTEVAGQQGCQIVAASHSEVILNEAAEKDVVVAFLGSPHRIDSRRRFQAAKSLRSIPFELYYLASKHGWILFLEGATDLAILRSLARRLFPEWIPAFVEPPVYYLRNNVPEQARDVFHGLKEACPNLKGIAVLDRLSREPESGGDLTFRTWRRREIENYITLQITLERFARHDQPDDLFGRAEADRRVTVMRECIAELERALQSLGKPSPWLGDLKVTDDFLDPLFKNYFARLGLSQLLFKKNYHVLADLLELRDLDDDAVEEIKAMLLTVSVFAFSAKPEAGQGD